MGTPQIGPGKAERFETHQRDTGRMRVTGRAEDAYAFRTPSLRMVTLTGPWGHAGAHSDLAAFLRHHADPRAGLADPALSPVLPAFDAARPDLAVMQAPWEVGQIAAAVTRPPVALAEAEIAAILAFLSTLTDETAAAGRLGIPPVVPSGLPVDR
jgi:cytochrome c peroxidase